MGLETMLCDLAGLLSGLDYLPEQGCTIGWALQLPKFSGQEGLKAILSSWAGIVSFFKWSDRKGSAANSAC